MTISNQHHANSKPRRTRGNKLIELLVAISIVGVVTAVASLGFSAVTTSSIITSCNINAKTVSDAAAGYQITHLGALPTRANLLGHGSTDVEATLASWPTSRFYTIAIEPGSAQVDVSLTSADPGYNWTTSLTAPTTIASTPQFFGGASQFKWTANVGVDPVPAKYDQSNICAGA